MDPISPISEGLGYGSPALSSGQGNGKGVENTPGDGGMAPSSGWVVLLKGDIFDPVQAILNLPMLLTGLEEVGCGPRGTAKVVDRFGKGVLVAFAAAVDDPDPGETGPLGL